MANDRATRYAEALFEVARAEGSADTVADEVFRFAKIYESNEDLRATLADATVPAHRRQQVVEELLGGRVNQTTTALVSMVVAAGRARDLPDIGRALLDRAAQEKQRAVAEVRSVVELTEEQRTRLAAALRKATGLDVEVSVVIDPSVKGGLITQIGDTVIDGSVRTKLSRLRESLV